MATAEIERFANAVRQDETLQAELASLTDVDTLIARAVQLARKHNFFFTAREVRASLNERLNAHHPPPPLYWHAVRHRL